MSVLLWGNAAAGLLAGSITAQSGVTARHRSLAALAAGDSSFFGAARIDQRLAGRVDGRGGGVAELVALSGSAASQVSLAASLRIVVPGAYCLPAGQVYLPGMEAGLAYEPGMAAGQVVCGEQ